jgi:hypothetical protein
LPKKRCAAEDCHSQPTLRTVEEIGNCTSVPFRGQMRHRSGTTRRSSCSPCVRERRAPSSTRQESQNNQSPDVLRCNYCSVEDREQDIGEDEQCSSTMEFRQWRPKHWSDCDSDKSPSAAASPHLSSFSLRVCSPYDEAQHETRSD